MNLNTGDLLTLSDNKKYVVVESKFLNNINYLYLIDINDYINVRFVKYDGDEKISEVTDINLIKELVNLFRKNEKND